MSAALCTHCTAEKWNLAAGKYRDNRTPENHAAAVAAQREHECAVSAANYTSKLLAMLKEMTDLAEAYGVGLDCDGNIIAARELIAKASGGAK